MTRDEQPDFGETMQRIEELVERIESLPAADVRAAARELARALLDAHRMGLERLVQRLRAAGEAGAAILEEAASDACVGSLLLLHDLHPLAAEERVRRAISALEPALRGQGLAVELVELSGGRARLSLSGPAASPLARAAMARAVEAAVADAAPDLSALEIEGAPAPPGLVPATRLIEGARRL
ncbi:uncharacterized protein SOCE26_083500 [Sorangium cellulosum]|uniref:NIF system FeS cluster assembly NifU C-terminal domain-containing protein n=1 Tax=Sorangium cellulosum TaxID=56 RepID=A0A2L0F5R6_SORCE|nr:NifU family protein [Sorangium cellulosum]AUX46841.1 uncharacterized protein SOCE26_083500 [Sorangium cellulosum]